MTLNECCALAQDMTRIPITVLQTPTDCMLFCTQYQFHPLQEYLLPRTMELFLEGLSENETVCVTDPFHIKTLFFRIGSVPLVLGPFCTEFYSLNDCESLLRQIELKNFSPEELAAHRGKIPVASKSSQQHIIHCLFRAMETPIPEDFREINYDKKNVRTIFQDVDSKIGRAHV